MVTSHNTLNRNWSVNGSFILHYINSKNDIMFEKKHLWNAIRQQAEHITYSSHSDYWHLAANYDLLNDEMKRWVDTKTSISTSLITFGALQDIIRESQDLYEDIFSPLEVEVVMDMLITNYNTQVTMLRKAEQYV